MPVCAPPQHTHIHICMFTFINRGPQTRFSFLPATVCRAFFQSNDYVCGLSCALRLKKICLSLTPSTTVCDLIWRQDLHSANQVEMRSLEWAPSQYDLCPYKKRGNLDTAVHRVTMPHEDKGRDQGDAATRQETPEVVSEPPAARGKPGDRFSWWFSEETSLPTPWPQTLASRL